VDGQQVDLISLFDVVNVCRKKRKTAMKEKTSTKIEDKKESLPEQ